VVPYDPGEQDISLHADAPVKRHQKYKPAPQKCTDSREAKIIMNYKWLDVMLCYLIAHSAQPHQGE
jgi:hypothetical protein